MERLEEIIGDIDQQYYAQITTWDYGTGPLEVTVYLYAPRNGERIMEEVIQRIQTIANKTGREVIHCYQATNEAARLLIAEKLGYHSYQYIREEQVGGQIWQMYQKIYKPEC